MNENPSQTLELHINFNQPVGYLKKKKKKNVRITINNKSQNKKTKLFFFPFLTKL